MVFDNKNKLKSYEQWLLLKYNNNLKQALDNYMSNETLEEYEHYKSIND